MNHISSLYKFHKIIQHIVYLHSTITLDIIHPRCYFTTQKTTVIFEGHNFTILLATCKHFILKNNSVHSAFINKIVQVFPPMLMQQ